MKNIADGHLVGWDSVFDDGEKAYGAEVEENNPSFIEEKEEPAPSLSIYRSELAKIAFAKRRKHTLIHGRERE